MYIFKFHYTYNVQLYISLMLLLMCTHGLDIVQTGWMAGPQKLHEKLSWHARSIGDIISCVSLRTHYTHQRHEINRESTMWWSIPVCQFFFEWLGICVLLFTNANPYYMQPLLHPIGNFEIDLILTLSTLWHSDSLYLGAELRIFSYLISIWVLAVVSLIFTHARAQYSQNKLM